MATKVETLRTTRPNTITRGIVASFVLAARNWAYRGQLGQTPTAAMRRYTGAR